MREASSTGAGLRDHFLLFSRFLRSPRTVGALTASSRALAEAMVTGLDHGQSRHIVELGPGTGALTGAIVDRLGTDSRFLAIDIDPRFVQQIRKRWPDVECVCASAERVDALAAERSMTPVDHIVSGLPFVSLPLPMTREILASIGRALRPGGTFTTFQYVHGYRLPSAVAFRARMNALMGSTPHRYLVVRNFPPALVLTWTKGTDQVRS
ncbi:MAG TPA: methyltransferase domain-containing protein [Vicinamibacterales bacterium]|jgi:phospholipid N-methyltransferase|nr:methyltransferase domain-containing protein [Vicinamibacterales bacterium]